MRILSYFMHVYHRSWSLIYLIGSDTKQVVLILFISIEEKLFLFFSSDNAFASSY